MLETEISLLQWYFLSLSDHNLNYLLKMLNLDSVLRCWNGFRIDSMTALDFQVVVVFYYSKFGNNLKTL